MTRFLREEGDPGGRRTSVEGIDGDEQSIEYDLHTPQPPIDEPGSLPEDHQPVDEPEKPEPPTQPGRRKQAGRRAKRPR